MFVNLYFICFITYFYFVLYCVVCIHVHNKQFLFNYIRLRIVNNMFMFMHGLCFPLSLNVSQHITSQDICVSSAKRFMWKFYSLSPNAADG